MRQSNRRAISRIEVLIILSVLVVVVAAFSTMFSVTLVRARHTAAQVKDASQIRGIHQSWVVFSREFNGIYPTPGLIDRLPFNGNHVPGRGPEDVTQNTTAKLFSACIMGNYFNSSLCIGITEPSSKVVDFENGNQTYDYNLYDPTQGLYWDSNFKADLHRVSHVSYAHMPIAGSLKQKQWRDSMDSTKPIIGNRGPLGGIHDPKSITNKIHPPFNRWSGNIIFADNHILVANGGFPTRPRGNGEDYLIAPECLPGGKQPPPTDAAITFTKEMTEYGPVVQHD